MTLEVAVRRTIRLINCTIGCVLIAAVLTGCEESVGDPDLVFNVAEDATNGTFVGTVSDASLDPSTPVEWEIVSGNTGDTFRIDPASGGLTVADNAGLDHELRPRITLRIRARDGAIVLSRRSVRVNVTDRPEAPSIHVGLQFQVAEDATDGTIVGTATAHDDESSAPSRVSLSTTIAGYANHPADTVVSGTGSDFDDELLLTRWRLETNAAGGRLTVYQERGTRQPLSQWAIVSGNEAGGFAIDADTGVITMVDGSTLDHVQTPRYTLSLTVSDGLLTSVPQDVIIHVTPVPLGPVGLESNRIEGLGVDHIIHISVDGLRSDAVTALGAAALPAFFRLRNEGAFTDNARTDGDLSYTLPNHASQFTGRSVFGAAGHWWWLPDDLSEYNVNLHTLRRQYVASVFDVVHDHGLSTALYTSKNKFSVYELSWNAANGAVDRVSPDSGRAKIDRYVLNRDIQDLVTRFLADLVTERFSYAFLHLKEPDAVGHDEGWSLAPGSAYLNAVIDVDAVLLQVLDFVDANASFRDSTIVILTSDHGGELDTMSHTLDRDASRIQSATIPFYVYGAGIAPGDLYDWSTGATTDPGDSIPFNDDTAQPIRNGDAANLVLQFLGLPNVTDSTIDNLSFPGF